MEESNKFINISFSIVEIQYFPCVNYFYYLSRSTYCVIEASESFQKMSFRNRTVVLSNNGLVSLSVPLKNGRDQKVLIREVEVDNSQSWKTQHWRTILSCYKKAPFFDYYAEQVEELIFSDKVFLFDLNLAILQWLIKVLKMPVSFGLTDEFVKIYQDASVQDLRNKWLPRNFQENLSDSFPKYPQVFEEKMGFQPNLSILDLLFCEGPNSTNILRKATFKA